MLNPMLPLTYYSQRWVQETIVLEARDKEVGVRIADAFGKRPDVLKYPQDVMEFARQKVTSFHLSEELWRNPLQLSPEMKKADQEQLRKGWDLVLDIDCPVWELAKTLAHALVLAIREHGVRNVSIKFSGNKGFHIGVPFESFPERIGGEATSLLFPDGPRRIASYLLEYVTKKYVSIDNGKLRFRFNEQESTFIITELSQQFGTPLTHTICAKCAKPWKEKKITTEFICPQCESRIVSEESYMKCPRCNVFMEKSSIPHKCSCGSHKYEEVFDPYSVIQVDTILIASRHLYRSSYSLHEKSGLISLPIDPARILAFSKEDARVDKILAPSIRFLDRTKSTAGEASRLLVESFDYKPVILEEEVAKEAKWDEITEAIPEAFFPPCIAQILKGVKDGRKRSLFVLVNFLTSVGWDYEMVEKRLQEWNTKNQEPLRQQAIVGHIRYHKQQKKKVLPPNCNNQMYYVGIGVCHPDGLCKRIKNPVQYAKLRARMASKPIAKPKKAKAPSTKPSTIPSTIDKQ